MYLREIILWLIPAMMLGDANAQKGLFIMTTGSRSYINYFGGIIEALTGSGHKITFITPYENMIDPENVTKVILKDDYRDKIVGNAFNWNIYEASKRYIELVPEICLSALTDQRVERVMKEEFDYVALSMYFSECFLPYIYERKMPLIYINPNTMMNPYSKRLGAPEFPSVSPNKIMKFAYPLSFWERTVTTVGGTLISFTFTKFLEEGIEQKSREMGLWPSETPSVEELHKQASLSIINSVRALEIPVKSTPPSIIYAGGIHIKPIKPLPKDLQDWLDGSGKDGFIYFSLGTTVKSSDIKNQQLQDILNVFRTLDQRIIWKWDAEYIEGLPNNVKISPWLPQTDILAHPKIRLFITHGGLFSTHETTYFSVPVVVMPVFGDQPSNAAEIEAQNYGRKVMWKEMTEESFRRAVMDTLTDKSLHKNVERRSQLMRDWPTTPADDVSYWVNYVIRHNGAKHLQSPLVHLTWYEIYNVDVWLLVLSVVIILIILLLYLTKLFVRFCIKKCFKRKTE